MPHSFRARLGRHSREPFITFLVAVAALAVMLAPARAQRVGAADEVRLVVTVTDDKGRYIAGLDKSHFSVVEGKDAREITAFDTADAPASVGVLVDVSGSTAAFGKDIKKQIALTLRQLIGGGRPETQYFIAEFNTQGYMLTDWTNDPSRLADAIQQFGAGLGKTRTGSNTALYDACRSALDKLAEGAHAKRVLVVVSDGQDNASRTRFKDLRRKIQESDVLVYGIGLIERDSPGTLDVGGQALLDELAVQSGGRAFFPEKVGEMIEAAERIAVELRH